MAGITHFRTEGKKLVVSVKAKCMPTYDHFWGIYKQQKCLYMFTLGHFKTLTAAISNSSKLETTQIPINNIMSKLTVVIHAVEHYITMKMINVKSHAKI